FEEHAAEEESRADAQQLETADGQESAESPIGPSESEARNGAEGDDEDVFTNHPGGDDEVLLRTEVPAPLADADSESHEHGHDDDDDDGDDARAAEGSDDHADNEAAREERGEDLSEGAPVDEHRAGPG